MSERFTPAVLRVLREAGCFEGRQADTAASSEAYLREWGLPIHRMAADILSEFDGLNCYAKDTKSWLKFDVREVLMWSDPWEVPAFGWVTGQPLCPVGHGNGSILLIRRVRRGRLVEGRLARVRPRGVISLRAGHAFPSRLWSSHLGVHR